MRADRESRRGRCADEAAASLSARPMVRPRRGITLLWALLGIIISSLVGLAVASLMKTESLVNENLDTGAQAYYVADQALSTYMAQYRPGDNMASVATDIPLVDPDDKDDTDTAFDLDTYTDADLTVRDLEFQDAWARVTPRKLVESTHGDVYLLEAESAVTDSRPNRPDAIRRVRTYAAMSPPIALRAAWNAPNGLYGNKTGERLTIEADKKGTCGAGSGMIPLATPEGRFKFENKKLKLEAASGVPKQDETAESYAELLASLNIPWASLTNEALIPKTAASAVVPRDYASLTAVPTSPSSVQNTWPIILVKGNVTLTSDYKGFGMLVVEGRLDIVGGKLTWSGMIVTGKGFSVSNSGSKKGHLHATGAVATGINCPGGTDTSAECRSELFGEHMGLKYSPCVVEAAWARFLALQPMTPTRYMRVD